MVKVVGSLDLEAGGSILDLRAENLASLPAAGNPGRIVFLTSDGNAYVDDGTVWKVLSAALAGISAIDAAFLTTNNDSTSAAGNEDGGLRVVFYDGVTQANAELRWDNVNKCWHAGFGLLLAKIARKYVHTETPAAATWNVNHDLDTLNPIVGILEDGTDEVIIPDSVTVVDVDNLDVVFGVATAGRAVVVG